MDQILKFQGKCLDDNKTLCEEKIRHGHVIELSVNVCQPRSMISRDDAYLKDQSERLISTLIETSEGQVVSILIKPS